MHRHSLLALWDRWLHLAKQGRASGSGRQLPAVALSRRPDQSSRRGIHAAWRLRRDKRVGPGSSDRHGTGQQYTERRRHAVRHADCRERHNEAAQADQENSTFLRVCRSGLSTAVKLIAAKLTTVDPRAAEPGGGGGGGQEEGPGIVIGLCRPFDAVRPC